MADLCEHRLPLLLETSHIYKALEPETSYKNDLRQSVEEKITVGAHNTNTDEELENLTAKPYVQSNGRMYTLSVVLGVIFFSIPPLLLTHLQYLQIYLSPLLYLHRSR